MMLALVLSTLLSFHSANAEELDFKNLKSPSDWKNLFSTCENNWEKYEADLARLRTSLKREIDGMTSGQYKKRWFADDAMIGFVRLHWPVLFEKHESAWEAFKPCSDVNWETRKILNSASTTNVEKSKKIQGLEQCVRSLFAPRGPLPFPFDRMMACYNKRAKS